MSLVGKSTRRFLSQFRDKHMNQESKNSEKQLQEEQILSDVFVCKKPKFVTESDTFLGPNRTLTLTKKRKRSQKGGKRKLKTSKSRRTQRRKRNRNIIHKNKNENDRNR